MSLEKLKNLKSRFLNLPPKIRQELAECMHKVHLGLAEESDHLRLQTDLQIATNALSSVAAGHLSDYLSQSDPEPGFDWHELDGILNSDESWQWAETDPALPRYDEDDVATLVESKKPFSP